LDPLFGQLAHDRVEQERHVVVDDLDERDGLDALGADRSVATVEANLWRARLALLEETPRLLGYRRNLARLVAREILRRGAGEQLARKGLRHVAVETGEDRPGLFDQPACGAFFIGVERTFDEHGYSLPGRAGAPSWRFPGRSSAIQSGASRGNGGALDAAAEPVMFRPTTLP